VPSAAKTALNAPLNRESRSWSRNVMVVARSVRSVSRLRAAWVVHAPVGCAVTPSRWARREPCSTAISAEIRLSMTVSTATKSTARAAWAWAVRNWRQVGPDRCGAGSMPASREDLPDGGGGDAVAESDQFALHAPVSPGGVLSCPAHHEVRDRRCGGWTSGSAACGVVRFPGDERAVPGQERGGCDREDLGPAVARQQSGHRGQPHPVGRCGAEPGDLAAQHGVLVL
jgi:hypothetical protein